MAVNDLYEVTLRSEQNGQPVFNVFHFIMTELVLDGFDVPKKLADAFWAQIDTDLLALMTDDLLVVEITGQRIVKAGELSPGTRGPLFVSSIGLTGLQADDSLPGFASHLIKLIALKPDGGYLNGSKYFAGVPEVGQNDGLLTPAQKALLDDVAALLDDPVTDSEGNLFAPVVASFTEWKAGAVGPWYTIEVAESSVVIAHQDRRKFGTARGGY